MSLLQERLPATNQLGRSMVEMLGVLAIIGVLSIGGLAGYSKAMESHKANLEIEQTNQLYTNIKTLCFNRTMLDCLGTVGDQAVSMSNLLIQTDNAPKEMQLKNDGLLYNPFGEQVHFTLTANQFLMWSRVPPSACKKMLTSGIDKMGKDLYLIRVGGGSSSGVLDFNWTADISTGQNFAALSMDSVAAACAEDRIHTTIPGKIQFERWFMY